MMQRPHLLALVAALAITAGCRKHPSVTVSNQSGSTVSNLVLSGNGFTLPLPPLAPGASTHVLVHPRSSSSVRLAFDSGRAFDSGNIGYLEPNPLYRVGIIVHSNGTVSFHDPAP